MFKWVVMLSIFSIFGCTKKDKRLQLKKLTEFQLNKELNETSGLAYANTTIYSHNDEKGIVYEIEPSSGKILNSIDYQIKGDFEGIEIIASLMFLITSKGEIYTHNLLTKTNHKISVKTNNEIEGLCKNPNDTHSLLLACKTSKNKKDKIILNYNYKNEQLDSNPYLKFTTKDLLKFNKKNKLKIKPKKLERFAPSGITFDTNNNLYVISARGSLLVVFNSNNSITNIIEINENTLPQPEGICFDDKGHLYISSEAKENTAKLCVYQLMD